VASAAAVWVLSVGVGVFFVEDAAAAAAAAAGLSVWALVALNTYAWDWRSILALLAVVALSAYVVTSSRSRSRRVADALAELWLPVPRALLSLLAWGLSVDKHLLLLLLAISIDPKEEAVLDEVEGADDVSSSSSSSSDED
jgi:hypothetical protein